MLKPASNIDIAMEKHYLFDHSVFDPKIDPGVAYFFRRCAQKKIALTWMRYEIHKILRIRSICPN